MLPLKVTKKPNKEEYLTIVKVSGLGILLIGLMGFLIQMIKQLLKNKLKDGQVISIPKKEGTKLIVNYSNKRATKDEYNRKRGLSRLEKQIKKGKLTKSNINNRDLNKSSILVFDGLGNYFQDIDNHYLLY